MSFDTFGIALPQLFKSFKNIQQRPRKILDKETVDEIIFNSKNTRDRLILELQARCGLRVGEVLNLKVSDVSQRKLMLQEPKSGREVEVAFMPEHIANRLADYIASRNLSTNDRAAMKKLFCYGALILLSHINISPVSEFCAIVSILFFCPEYKGSSNEYAIIGLNPLPAYSNVLNK